MWIDRGISIMGVMSDLWTVPEGLGGLPWAHLEVLIGFGWVQTHKIECGISIIFTTDNYILWSKDSEYPEGIGIHWIFDFWSVSIILSVVL